MIPDCFEHKPYISLDNKVNRINNYTVLCRKVGGHRMLEYNSVRADLEELAFKNLLNAWTM